MGGMMPLATGIAFGPPGLALAWNGTFGTAVAWMRSPSAVRPDWCRHVGRETGGVGQPRIAFSGPDEIVVSWCEDDGARVAVLGATGGEARFGPFPFLPNAYQSAIATNGRRVLVAAVDGEGIVAVDAHTSDSIESAKLVRIVVQRGLDPCLAATELGDGWLVVCSLADEQMLGLCVLAGGAVRDVRHRVSAKVNAVDAAAAGSSAAVALGYDGAHAERVDVALVGSDGKLNQRPHVYLEDLGARFVAPRVHWMESRFVATAIEAATGELVFGVGGSRLPTGLSSLPETSAVASYAERVVAIGVTEDGGATSLVHASCRQDAGGASMGRMALVPTDGEARARRSRARRVLVESATRLGGPGYRSVEAAIEIEPDRLEMSVRRAGGSARARVEPADDDTWRVSIATWTDANGDAPAPTRSVVRLARWLRARWSEEERHAAEAARRWADSVAQIIGARVSGLDWVTGARAVTFEAPSMPSAEVISRAITRALDPA